MQPNRKNSATRHAARARWRAGLLRFDAGGLDDTAPFVRLGFDVGREFIRRAGDDFHAFRHHPLLQLGRAQAARDFVVKLVDDGTRRSGRRQNAEEVAALFWTRDRIGISRRIALPLQDLPGRRRDLLIDATTFIRRCRSARGLCGSRSRRQFELGARFPGHCLETPT